MNRKERRAKNARLKMFKGWEQVPEGTLIPGRVVHVVMFHDDACPCADGKHSSLHCTCNPDVTCYLQPKKVA